MNLHEALQKAVNDAAEKLVLPIGWEGEVFTPPLTSHLRAKIVYDDNKFASLGTNALRQVDGRIDVRVVIASGDGDALPRTLARQFAALFPRGMDVPVENGELTLKTNSVGTMITDGSRLSVPVSIPFYALMQE